ncbi:MAG: hypothetical protein ACRBCJ_06010 [Hyphomicrobiaceae bacterium]
MKSIISIASAAFILAFAHSITIANAGGFSRTTGAGAFGAASSGTSVNVRSKYAKYKSNTYANTSVQVLYGGRIAIGKAKAGSHTSYYAKGKSKFKQWKQTKAKVYAKGGNVLAKARTSNYVTIRAAGKTYVVSHEVARSIARFTPLGTTAAASSNTYVSGASSQYLGITTGGTASAVVRIKR